MMNEVIEGLRLSPQQKHLWSLQQHDRVLPYRAQVVVRIDGRLDTDSLLAAINQVVQQHEILRTTFCCLPGMTIPLQVINESNQAGVTLKDCEETQIENLFSEMSFDLKNGPLMQVALVKISDVRNILLIALPAMSADRASLRNLVEEISRNYVAVLNDECVDSQPLQYADSSEWHNDLLEAPEREEGRAYWREQDFSATQLPFAVQHTDDTDFTPQFITLNLKVEHAAPALLLLACWQVLLWRLTSQPQVVIGCATDGRAHEELKPALGLFERYLPTRSDLHENLRFAELLDQLGRTMRESREYQEYFTWEGEGYFPLSFEYVEQAESCEAGGLKFTIISEYACTERYEVKLSCVRSEAGLRVEFHYDSSRHEEADIERLAAQYQRLLASVLENEHAPLAELEVVSQWEQQQLLKWNETAVVYDAEQRIQELFEQQAAERPHATAVVCGGESLSYEELNQRANQLAHYLRRVGVGPEVRVGLCVERSLEMVVGVLGILKAGGAYVPLDPSYPAARLELVLADCGATVLLTEAHLEEQWEQIAQESVTNPEVTVTAENLAYVIYTSGSTGRPKGVGVTHQNLVHTTGARKLYYGTTPRSFLLLSSIAFDSSVAGLFWTLCGGGRLVVPEEGMQREVRALVRLVQEHEVTHLLCLPSLYALLLEEGRGGELANLEGAIVAGEACGPRLVRRHEEVVPQAMLYNEYGPTEGSVWSTVQQCHVESSEALVPIGRPIANVRVYVLNERMRMAPLGVSGELYVGGAGVTRGYLNDAALTAARFVPDPFSGERGGRLYRTGDEARHRASGEIEFLGRVDNQVKIRGYRIELGEIEAVLREHAAVREAVVIAGDDGVGGKRLAGYLVLDEQQGLTARQLLRYKREGVLARLGSCELPNGMTIISHNKNEAEYLYHEIFEEQSYFAHGIKLERSACVFDVGANIGLFSLFVGHVCEDARIYAFEPIPQVFKVLRANSQLYGLKARLFECGLSNEARRETFTYYPHLSLMSGLFADANEAQAVVKSFEVNKQLMKGGVALPGDAALDELLDARLTSERVECRLRTISEVIAEEGVERIDLLKIDVEKSELNVLLGITPSDWSRIKQVVVEVEDTEQRLEQITDLLSRHGFELAIEQDLALTNTKLYKVYAVRAADKLVGEPRKKLSPSRKSAWSSPAVVLDEVRELLKQKLPEHMIPGALVLLEELPLMPNGKIDRLMLPAPEQMVSEEEQTLPQTPVEEVLANIWSEVLGVRKLSVTANFFELGGHSLLATQVISRVREAFQVELPVRSLFAQPTVRGLAAEVGAQLQAAQGVQLPPIKAGRREGELPLSYAQQRLWFADQMMPGTALYNMAAAMRLSGVLNVKALERTLAEITRRHEVLRTSFPAIDGRPIQVIAPASDFTLAVTDLTHLEVTERETEAYRLVSAEAHKPFDLSSGPLLRAELLRLGEAEHIVILTMHHIAGDAWSKGVLIREVAALYESYRAGAESPLPELPVQYADYAVWQRKSLSGEVLDKQLEYWQEQLAGAPEKLALPTDRERSVAQNYRAGTYPVAFTHEMSEQLKTLSRRETATVFMTVLAAFKVLLHYYSKQHDILVGANVANRNRAETEGLIGFFVNTVVLRTSLAGDPSFVELLKRVREVCLGAYAHEDVPFEKVVALLQPERTLDRQPLFQVKLDVDDELTQALELHGLTLSPLDLPTDVGRYDLHLILTNTAEGLVGEIVYDKNLFDEATVGMMSSQLETLLAGVIKQPDVRLSALAEVLARADKQYQAGREKDYKNTVQQKFKQARQGSALI
jgi:amino acid adenylation domain-containing protein/FkbM family methyltransferase